MQTIMPELSRWEKRKLRIWIKRESDAGTRTRMLMLLQVSKSKPVAEVAEGLHVARSTGYRLLSRFNERGWSALADRREENGRTGVDEMFLLQLREVVAGSPQDYGWSRPTWTQELLCEVMAERTGVRVGQSTMSRLLKKIGARLGRPRPVLRCPWKKGRKARHLRKIDRLVKHLPKNEVAVYEDEVDIHLNPKIGLDWMLPGQQKEVVTPGQNVKRYLAGAKDVRTGLIHWVAGAHKRSGLFIDLLKRLLKAYPSAKVIHVIADNYIIHKSRQTQLALAGMPRIRLHFLPPYCPSFNPIERVWLDLHAEVTRNHRCQTINELMTEVEYYLKHRNRETSRSQQRAVA
jgi:transposase